MGRISQYRGWIRKQIEDPCETGYTCYIEECNGPYGPNSFLEDLKAATFSYQKRRIVEELHKLKCPVNQPQEEMQSLKRFCCPDSQDQPIDCKWGEYTWGECDTTCGGGIQTGTRKYAQLAKNGGKECVGAGKFTTTRRCNEQDCPGPVPRGRGQGSIPPALSDVLRTIGQRDRVFPRPHVTSSSGEHDPCDVCGENT